MRYRSKFYGDWTNRWRDMAIFKDFFNMASIHHLGFSTCMFRPPRWVFVGFYLCVKRDLKSTQMICNFSYFASLARNALPLSIPLTHPSHHSWPITLSFHLKPSFSAWSPSHRSLPFLLHGWLHVFPDLYRYLWAHPFSFPLFLVWFRVQ